MRTYEETPEVELARILDEAGYEDEQEALDWHEECMREDEGYAEQYNDWKHRE
jgi:hypothetical protein